MNNLAYKHYGRNIELLIEKAIQMDNEEEQFIAIVYIGKLMKSFYATWNKENVDDAVILGHLREMSKNKLSLPLERIKAESLFDPSSSRERERAPSTSSSSTSRNNPVNMKRSAGNSTNNNNGNTKRPTDNKRKNK